MLKDKLKRLFDLQLFNDDPEGGEPNSGENDQPPTGGTPDQGKPEPFAVFNDEKSFMKRVNREANKQQKELFTTLGVDSAEALQTIIAEYNKAKEGEQTELQKAIARAEKAERATNELLNKFNTETKTSTVKSLAIELGVEAGRISRFMKLVDMDSIELIKGEIDKDSLKESLTEILDDFPEFRGVKPTGRSGGAEFNGGSGDKSKITFADLKNMSSAEIAKLMLENPKAYEEAIKNK